MGIVRMGAPDQLIMSLIEALSIKNFVETGTYKGATAEWASKCFDTVYTIETCKDLCEETAARLGYVSNIRFVSGDSRLEMVVVPRGNRYHMRYSQGIGSVFSAAW